MKRLNIILLIVLTGLMLAPQGDDHQASAQAKSGMVYIYNAPESALDRRYDSHWEILRTALDRTRQKYGDFALHPSRPMSEKRQTSELMKGSRFINVMHLGTTQEFERNLGPIRIPVDKNLSGYMVYLIRKEDQARFASVNNIDDLRKFTIGQGADWLDVEILRHNGFEVVGGTSYDGLFRMLVRNRFDAFQRSAVEILEEFDQRNKEMPKLHIEENLLVYYPLPMYFWFSKNDAGQKLAERAREGMMAMIEDGTYDAIFMKYHAKKIERLGLKKRKFFKIENPLLVPDTPFDDKRLWFDPRR